MAVTRGRASIRLRLPRPTQRRCLACWVVEGPRQVLARIADLLPRRVCDPLADGLLLLTFGNAVGRYRAGPLGTIEVHSGKWGEEDYDRLLERIAEEAEALPFSAGTPSALPFERAVRDADDVLYHAFVFLRHVLGPTASREHALRPALEGILRNPHRRLQRTARVVSIGRARRIDARTLDDVVAGRWPMMRAPPSSGPLALALGNRLPVEIEEPVSRDTLDTPENRFIKAFLGSCAWVVDRMRARAEVASSTLKSRILAGCDTVDRGLRPVRQHSMWRAVGPMVHLPASSTVLHGRRSYRAVFQAHNRLRLGSRLPLDGPTSEALLEVKDIALLYEVWSCFALIRALKETLGSPRSVGRIRVDDLQKGVPWEYRAAWPGGIRLTYNPRFSPGRGGGRSSYSVPLRPDLALWIPPDRPNSGYHLFDAKFKVDWLETALPTGEEDDEAEGEVADQERTGVFKRADIYKMHTYRDAIPMARTAWVIYPGTEHLFFAHPVDKGEGAALDGVGAVPLDTGGPGDALLNLTEELTSTGPIETPTGH